MRFRKIYLEISNVCNLSCSFCHKTKRKPRIMQRNELEEILPKLREYTDYLYFHLMGEPLLHPDLKYFLETAARYGFKVIITTNGVLLNEKRDILFSSPALHKINISLHAFEANDLSVSFKKYLENCLSFGKKASEGSSKIVIYRLWNRGGEDKLNQEIISAVSSHFGNIDEKEHDRRGGIKLADRVFLEYGDKFDWPDINATDNGSEVFCYGLRDQLGILCDGTVVPCCLDCEGDIALGNIFESDLENILATKRAKDIYEGFSNRIATEELCRRCGYAKRFNKS